MIDVVRKIIYSSFEGELNDEDILTHGTMLKHHPEFNPDFSEIVDFRKITRINVTVQFINSMAKSPSLFKPSSRHAVIAPHDLIYGIGRMYQMLAEETRPNMAVVRTLEEACKFLGIDSAGFAGS